jgi:hypothetical protein
MGTEYRLKDENSYDVKVCNLCPKGNKNDPGNLWKLHIFENGNYYCFRCSEKGSWYKLKSLVRNTTTGISTSLSTLNEIITNKNANDSDTDQKVSMTIPTDQNSLNKYSYELFHKSTNETKKVLKYLNTKRGLNTDILKKYRVGISKQQFQNDKGDWELELCVTFPWMISKESPSSSTSSNLTTEILETKTEILSPILDINDVNNNNISENNHLHENNSTNIQDLTTSQNSTSTSTEDKIEEDMNSFNNDLLHYNIIRVKHRYLFHIYHI